MPLSNRPQTRLRARNLAYTGTVQPAVGQTLGRAVQIQRLPTPSRALCLETHQTRPCPRNHRPGRVRTWPRLQSGRNIAGRLAIPTCLPAPRACGRHSLICNTPDRVRPLLRIAATEVGHLPRLVAAGPHALPSAHGLCVSVAVRQPIPTLAGACAWRVAWVPCAAYIPPGMHHPGARSTHRPQAVVIPRLRHLGWPRMRGVASVCSHYAQIPNHLRFASVHIDHSQWISSARSPAPGRKRGVAGGLMRSIGALINMYHFEAAT